MQQLVLCPCKQQLGTSPIFFSFAFWTWGKGLCTANTLLHACCFIAKSTAMGPTYCGLKLCTRINPSYLQAYLISGITVVMERQLRHKPMWKNLEDFNLFYFSCAFLYLCFVPEWTAYGRKYFQEPWGHCTCISCNNVMFLLLKRKSNALACTEHMLISSFFRHK